MADRGEHAHRNHGRIRPRRLASAGAFWSRDAMHCQATRWISGILKRDTVGSLLLPVTHNPLKFKAADREGFEPSVTFPPHTLSKRAH